MFSIILPFWFLHIVIRIFYYLYFWQLKMYRADRFFEEIRRDKRIILPKVSIGAFLLLVLYFPASMVSSYGAFFIAVLILVLYLIFGLKTLLLLVKKKYRIPIFTKKMILLSLLIILLLGVLLFFLHAKFFLFILCFEIFLPLFIFLIVQAIEFPVSIYKKYIYKKAEKKRASFKDLIVIGITGSYGKSATKEFLYSILVEKYGKDKVLKTKGNINTEIGVAKTILNDLNKDHKFFVCEMAAYKRGEIKTSCEITKPQIGILTGINQQHLELFGSQENIIRGKYELIESLPSDGSAFFNTKNKHCIELYNKTSLNKKYLYAQDTKDFEEENISGAIAVAKELGVTNEDIEKINFRKKLTVENINGFKIIKSIYSTNPTAVIAHLDYLKNFSGKKIIIMPSLIELGGEGRNVHKTIGKKISKVCDLAIITTKDYFEEIREESDNRALLITNASKIMETINKFKNEDHIILLEGKIQKHLIKDLL